MIAKKEAMNLKETRKECMGEVGGRKGKEGNIVIIISEIKSRALSY